VVIFFTPKQLLYLRLSAKSYDNANAILAAVKSRPGLEIWTAWWIYIGFRIL